MKAIITLLTGSIFAILLIAGTMNNGGSPGKKAGSPLDGASCLQCHSGSSTQVDWITTNIPESGWVPGQTYIITLNASHGTAPKIGFELTAENSSEKTGSFKITDADRTRLSFSDKSVTHKSAGTTPIDGTLSWEMEWTAPEVDKGEITFYAAINAANGNGSTSGDTIFTSSLTLAQDATTTGIPNSETQTFKIFPNPAKQFINVQLSENADEVSLFSLNGQHIKTFNHQNNTINKFDISNVPSGLYLVKAQSRENQWVQKVSIE